MKLFTIPIKDIPPKGAVLSIKGEYYKVYRRDFKRHRYWCYLFSPKETE